ncbi:MAG: hypothetical protein [Caudoviricetes sp.]|nr:MAG: hypothetical protein [Caudoviricetes sp.]
MRKYEWSGVPENINWIATDEMKSVWGFTHFPSEVYSNGFSCGDDGQLFLLLRIKPYQGDWMESIEQRQEEQSQ